MTQKLTVVVGTCVRLRKKHPCGSDAWKVTRVGADIGAVCTGCGRKAMFDREEFERRVRQILPHLDMTVTEDLT